MTARVSGGEIGTVAQPGALVGTVERTGIAVLHRGEAVLAAPGSEAEILRADQDARTTIVYELPVHVTMVAADDARLREEIIREAFHRLRQAIEGRREGA